VTRAFFGEVDPVRHQKGEPKMSDHSTHVETAPVAGRTEKSCLFHQKASIKKSLYVSFVPAFTLAKAKASVAPVPSGS
jgi:hypothetical protein